MSPEELRKLIQSTGLTQERFGNWVLGCTSGAISRWLAGQRHIGYIKGLGIRTAVKDYLKQRPKPRSDATQS